MHELVSMSSSLDLRPRDRSESVVDFVIAKICEGLRSGRYTAGQRLPQAELVTQLGISRPVLREALNRLAADGVVALEQNHGASIRRLRREDVHEIYEMREVLEGLAARRCAQKIDAGDNAQKLRVLASDMERAVASSDPEDYIESNAEFHNAILELSGHGRAQALVPKLLLPLVRLVFTRLAGPEERMRSYAEHRVVLDGILAGEADWAEAAMRRHIRRSCDALLRAHITFELGLNSERQAVDEK
jgi:DNA-binding GntR family transcriptional regulator